MRHKLTLIHRYMKHLDTLRASESFGRLAVEITFVLIIKILLLWLLWSLCFSHPIEKSERQKALTGLILNKGNI